VADLKISDDELRESIETNQLKLMKERGSDITLFMTTAKGAETREFLGESRFELRKVVWPTRQETTRTTWVVIVVVIIMSLILALFDWLIQLGVKALLGT
jgi:preprotein translocase subunit SecE